MPDNRYTGRKPACYIRLYRLQSKDTGEQWGHAMPMNAAVKAQHNAKRLGYECGIVRVQ